MKTYLRLLPLLLFSLPILACSGVLDFGRGRVIAASSAVIRETREVSGFTGVDMRGIGKLVLVQGDSESLEVSGPDNVVPLVRTSVQGGVLVLELQPENIVTGMNPADMLTFSVGVKDLSSVSVSGLGDVEMDGLKAPRLNVTMSGSGRIALRSLALDGLVLRLSGMGDVTLSGGAADAEIDISGAGNVNAPDLRIQTARITISGAGSATLWVTDSLTGTISGAGNIEYYGNPEVHANTSGVGRFKPLGNK
jgi:hypothetical protein